MLQSLKHFLAFNKSDRAAAFLLAIIIGFIAFVPYVINLTKTNYALSAFEVQENEPQGIINTTISQDTVIKTIEQLTSLHSKNVVKTEKQEVEQPKQLEKKKQAQKVIKKFNPNVTTKSELMALGVNEYAASNWVKYLQKGGRITKPEQMKTIYGVELHEYEKLLPLAEIDPFYSNIIEKDTSIVINLNTATFKDLQKIKGIGEKRAKTIVDYRNHLGGFVSVEQLKEIPRFPKKNFKKIVKQLKIEPNTISKLNLNKSNLSNLVYHPYIDSTMAKNVIDFRANNGLITSVIELKTVKGFNQEKIEKLTPYLRFD